MVDASTLMDRQLPIEEQLSICEAPYQGVNRQRRQEYHQFLLRRWVVDQYALKNNTLPSLETIEQLILFGKWQRIAEQLQGTESPEKSHLAKNEVAPQDIDQDERERLIYHDPPLNERHPQFRNHLQSNYVSTALELIRQKAPSHAD
jgi:hypothetical protein